MSWARLPWQQLPFIFTHHKYTALWSPPSSTCRQLSLHPLLGKTGTCEAHGRYVALAGWVNGQSQGSELHVTWEKSSLLLSL